jgi:hypothetical protein
MAAPEEQRQVQAAEAVLRSLQAKRPEYHGRREAFAARIFTAKT